jgi:hypothetical protein
VVVMVAIEQDRCPARVYVWQIADISPGELPCVCAN